MSKYLVTDNDRVEVKLYVDTRSNKLKVYTEKEIKAVVASEIATFESRLATLNAMEETKVVKDEKAMITVKITDINKSGYPEYVTEEKIWWQKIDGIAHEYINKKGYVRAQNRPTATFDSTEYNKAFIAVLLREWTLAKTDERLMLKTEAVPGFTNRKMIDAATLENICKLDSTLYNAIINTGYEKLYGEDDDSKN